MHNLVISHLYSLQNEYLLQGEIYVDNHFMFADGSAQLQVLAKTSKRSFGGSHSPDHPELFLCPLEVQQMFLPKHWMCWKEVRVMFGQSIHCSQEHLPVPSGLCGSKALLLKAGAPRSVAPKSQIQTTLSAWPRVL